MLLVRLGVEPFELFDLHCERHGLFSQRSELVAQRRDCVRNRDRARVVELRADGGGRGVDGAAAAVPPKLGIVLRSQTQRQPRAANCAAVRGDTVGVRGAAGRAQVGDDGTDVVVLKRVRRRTVLVHQLICGNVTAAGTNTPGSHRGSK